MQPLTIPLFLVVAFTAGGTAVWFSAGAGTGARPDGPAPAFADPDSFSLPDVMDGPEPLLAAVRALPPQTTRAHEYNGRITRYDLRYPSQNMELSLVRVPASRRADRRTNHWQLHAFGRDTRTGLSLRTEDVLARLGAEGAANRATPDGTALPAVQ